MARVDFLLENNDLVISNEDLVIGVSDQQHVQDLIFGGLGWYRFSPLVGADANRYLNAPATQLAEFQSAIKRNLQNDGYNNLTVEVGEFTSEKQEIKIYE